MMEALEPGFSGFAIARDLLLEQAVDDALLRRTRSLPGGGFWRHKVRYRLGASVQGPPTTIPATARSTAMTPMAGVARMNKATP